MATAATRCACGAHEETTGGGIALVGQPNVGKSVLFQRLTGNYVVVANYPGTTVEVARGASRFAPDTAVLDTPGILSLPPRSEDEQVVTRALLSGDVQGLVHVGDMKNLRRTLLLTVQLAELGLPLVLALNMRDEAVARGIDVDSAALEDELGARVVTTVATRGEGLGELVHAMEDPAVPRLRVDYAGPIEDALAALAERLPAGPVDPRGLALLCLGGDAAAAEWVAERLSPRELAALADVRSRAAAALGEEVSAAVQRSRVAVVDALVERVLVASPRAADGLGAKLARLTTHAVRGWPVLAAVLYLVYLFVGRFGAGTLVGLLENDVFGTHVNPWLTGAVERVLPVAFLSDLLVGEYGLWTMGMTYALALILPIVGTFFLAFGILEDSGYLPRLAVVSNRLFSRLGLNGKAALPMVLGLGCVTMATLTTRVLETKRERVLVTLLLALGIPCSAQLGVVLGMLGAISLTATLIWSAVVAGLVLAVGALAARVLPGERSPLVVELPPLRVPRASAVVVKTVARLEWYLKEVVPLFLLGTAFLFVLDRTGALGWVIDAGRPLVVQWLGLPAAASAAFLVGFLRRDFGATGLFVMQANGLLSAEQAVVAMVTITLFIPCVASVLVLVRERGARAAVAIAATVFPLAFLAGGVLHRVLLLVGWGA